MEQLTRISTPNRQHIGLPADISAKSPFRVSPWVWFALVIPCAWTITTANPGSTTFAILLLPVIAKLVWRRGEPPLLMFVCGMQWLQASAAIFYVNFYNVSLAEAFGGTELERASWLSLTGVLALAVGMRLALFRSPAPREKRQELDGQSYSIGLLFGVYALAFAVSYLSSVIAGGIPALAQALFALANIKWTLLFMLLYCVSVQRRSYLFAWAAVAVEVLSGILGYFAGFKGVFFVVLVVGLSSAAALRGKRLLAISGIGLVLIASGLIWTAVKSDYREFLTQGLRSQEVLAPVEERVGKLQDLITDFRWGQLGEAAEALTLRISYVQYFALTLLNVPASIPHEHGALWGGAIRHVVTPRILFPNKAALDDSERASLYTGMEVAGADRGTSIGIGYIAESYVDYGAIGMFAPILLLGVFYGFIYRQFVIVSRYPLLGCGIATAILVFGGNIIETSNVKIVGGNLTALLVATTFYFVLGPRLQSWLTRSDG